MNTDGHKEDRGKETLLIYTAKAEVGGKLAQLGSRLVLSTSKKLAAKFFDALAKELSPEEVSAAE